MHKITAGGREAFASQIIGRNLAYDNGIEVIAMSLCGREMPVRAITADFLSRGSIDVLIDGQSQGLVKGPFPFGIKGAKISRNYFQCILWNREQIAAVVRPSECFKFINAHYSVPFHPLWEGLIWDRIIEKRFAEQLSCVGTDEEYWLVEMHNATLQSLVLENIDELRMILDGAYA